MRRAVRWLVVASLGLGSFAACREIPSPEGGIQAVSPVLLPLPGLVVGDTMRDSTGAVSPLRVIAYALDGDPLSPQPDPTFVVLDSGAHVAGALLIGDSTRSVRVVGSVGTLQTQPVTVRITQSPDTLRAADSTLHHKTYSIPPDTASVSADLGVLVQHFGSDTTGVDAVIVHYTIDQAPPGNGQGPTVVLTSGGVLSSRDTTDTNGRAARSARLRLGALSTLVEDTVRVSASASYRGNTLGTVQFTIVYTKQ